MKSQATSNPNSALNEDQVTHMNGPCSESGRKLTSDLLLGGASSVQAPCHMYTMHIVTAYVSLMQLRRGMRGCGGGVALQLCMMLAR
jgi:hypothetical protein